MTFTYEQACAIAYAINCTHDGEAFIYLPEYITEADVEYISDAE